MRNWMRRVRGAFGLGLTWALGWGFVGGVIEAIWNVWPGFPLGPLVDIWPLVLAIPGFFGGAFFSAVLGVAARHRQFDELSLPGFAGLGAVGGLLAGSLAVLTLGPVTTLAAGAVIVGTTTVLSAASATGTLALARLSARRALPDAPDTGLLGKN